jgi:hypothetical protein
MGVMKAAHGERTMKKKPAKLQIPKETLRVLQIVDMPRVAGGDTHSDYENSCYPNYCYVESYLCP